MCTLTWWPAPAGYDLFFNRDELNTRTSELPPQEEQAGELRFLAPRDGQRGGTWIAVNEHGLTLALLNDYTAAWRAPEPRASRGALVWACASAPSLEAVAERVAEQDLGHTGAFHLFAIDATVVPLLLHWDGARLTTARAGEVPPILSSSSFRPAEVIAHRRAAYDGLLAAGRRASLPDVAAFHRRHDPAAGAYSVCMRRPDARTRSITHVAVRPESIDLFYERQTWNGARLPEERFRLARALACDRERCDGA